MNKNKCFESSEVTLTPVSPIHISAGEPDYGSSAIRIDDTLYIIDEEKLGKFLSENNLLNLYIDFAEDWILKNTNIGERKGNMLEKFFKGSSIKRKIDFEKIKQELCYSHLFYKYFGKGKFIREGNGNPYIPGSSIKGAIRTALMFKILYEYNKTNSIDILHDYLKGKFPINPQSLSRQDRKKLKETLDDDLIKQVFEYYDIKHPKITEDKLKHGSNTDFMRAISVSDSTIIDMNPDKSLFDVVAYSLDEEFYIKRGAPAGLHELFFNFEDNTDQQKVSFRITIDHKILSDFGKGISKDKGFKMPFSCMKDIQESLELYSSEVWREECIFFCGYPPDPFDPVKRAEQTYKDNTDIFNNLISNGQKKEFCLFLIEKIGFNIIGWKKAGAIYDKIIASTSDIKDSIISELSDKEIWKEGKIKRIPATIKGNSAEVENIVTFYKNKHEKQPNIRLGYGSGLMGTTLFPMIHERNGMNFRKRIRDLHKEIDHPVAPKSRRLVVNNHVPVYPLGWAYLEF